MKVYIAGPLFNEMELQRNQQICEYIEGWGFDTFLPQRDAGEAAMGANRRIIFNTDIAGMNSCDICVALVDGRTMDEGTCFEIGYMYAKHKPIIVYKTDKRCFMVGHDNVMINYCGVYANDLFSLESAVVAAAVDIETRHDDCDEFADWEKG